MRIILVFLVCLAVGCVPSPKPTDSADVDAYFQAKARYASTARDSATVVAALKDLEARARTLIGPVSIEGLSPTFSIQAFPSTDMDATLLDGLVFADIRARTTIIVTTPAMIRGSLRLPKDSTIDPLVAVAHEDRLTWVFDENAHVSPFADLKAKTALPSDVFIALLVARSNDIPFEADEIILGVQRGHLVYLMIAPAEAKVTAPASCGSPLADEPYRKCFDRHAASHPDFPKIVAQVSAMRDRLPGPRR